MSQFTIDGQYAKEFESAKEIVSSYLSVCRECRNSDKHMIQHIWQAHPTLNPETLRRTRQKIQNDYHLFLADPDTQAHRQAKEKYIRDNVKKM